MALNPDYLVRPAHPGDQDQISTLLSNGHYVHRHLDWRTPLEWIGFHPYLVIEETGRIRAVLACPPDPLSIGWVRVFAADRTFPVRDAWNILWADILPMLGGVKSETVAAITLQVWFQEVLEESRFSSQQQIVMLTWAGKNVSDVKLPAGFLIRNMVEEDIEQVAEVDAAAFVPLWQNSSDALHKAFRQAALATIIEEQGVIVAYQLSTKNFLGGHLARLAVHPDLQGKGIGYLLVSDMIHKLHLLGVDTISVNTQSDNLISLSLYKRMGFEETGERYPVYTYGSSK
jgi:ribosomal protein S18 acetylase RimI-like enzyme